jgi:hypothetical protein
MAQPRMPSEFRMRRVYFRSHFRNFGRVSIRYSCVPRAMAESPATPCKNTTKNRPNDVLPLTLNAPIPRLQRPTFPPAFLALGFLNHPSTAAVVTRLPEDLAHWSSKPFHRHANPASISVADPAHKCRLGPLGFEVLHVGGGISGSLLSRDFAATLGGLFLEQFVDCIHL